jgi:hypothetical protein
MYQLFIKEKVLKNKEIITITIKIKLIVINSLSLLDKFCKRKSLAIYILR